MAHVVEHILNKRNSAVLPRLVQLSSTSFNHPCHAEFLCTSSLELIHYCIDFAEIRKKPDRLGSLTVERVTGVSGRNEQYMQATLGYHPPMNSHLALLLTCVDSSIPQTDEVSVCKQHKDYVPNLCRFDQTFGQSTAGGRCHCLSDGMRPIPANLQS